LQIMFPQLFALFQFYFYSLAVEMLFFSLLCPQGVNSTNFARNQSRRQGVSYLTMLVNLVHSASVIDLFVLHRRRLTLPSAVIEKRHCLCSAWYVKCTWHATCVQLASLKKVKVEPALCTLQWLCHNNVRPTKSHKWHYSTQTLMIALWVNDLSWYLAGRPWASANLSLIS
jgi:hypothetical protein